MDLKQGYRGQSSWAVGNTFKSRRISMTRGKTEENPMIIIIANCLSLTYNYFLLLNWYY